MGLNIWPSASRRRRCCGSDLEGHGLQPGLLPHLDDLRGQRPHAGGHLAVGQLHAALHEAATIVAEARVLGRLDPALSDGFTDRAVSG